MVWKPFETSFVYRMDSAPPPVIIHKACVTAAILPYICECDLTREDLCSSCADTALLEDEELEHAQIMLPVKEVGLLLQPASSLRGSLSLGLSYGAQQHLH